MSLKHCFDLYTIRIRKKRNTSAEPLENFDGNGTDFFAVVSDCVQNIDDFSDDTNKKMLAIKDHSKSDNKLFSIYGKLKSGAYGAASEVVNRKNKMTTPLTEDDANVFSFFFYFYIPRKSTTGALIVHRIGNHGMYSQLKEVLLQSFKQISDEHVLDLEPIFFNLKNSKDCSLKKIEVVLSHKKTAVQKAVSGSRSPSVRSVGKFILEVGNAPSVLSQLLKADDVTDFAVDQVTPFLQTKALEKYDVSFSAKVQIGGLNKTIQIAKNFSYNTSLDLTDELKLKDGLPTIESLLDNAKKTIQLLKDNKKI